MTTYIKYIVIGAAACGLLVIIKKGISACIGGMRRCCPCCFKTKFDPEEEVHVCGSCGQELKSAQAARNGAVFLLVPPNYDNTTIDEEGDEIKEGDTLLQRQQQQLDPVIDFAHTLCLSCERRARGRRPDQDKIKDAADLLARERLAHLSKSVRSDLSETTVRTRSAERTSSGSRKKKAASDVLLGYLEHVDSGLLVHPQGGLAKENVGLVLHEGPPIRRLLLQFHPDGTIYHEQSGRQIIAENPRSKDTQLLFRGSGRSGGAEEQAFEFDQYGVWRHVVSGAVVKPASGGVLDSQIRMVQMGGSSSGEAAAVMGLPKFRVIVDHAWMQIKMHGGEN